MVLANVYLTWQTMLFPLRADVMCKKFAQKSFFVISTRNCIPIHIKFTVRRNAINKNMNNLRKVHGEKSKQMQKLCKFGLQIAVCFCNWKKTILVTRRRNFGLTFFFVPFQPQLLHKVQSILNPKSFTGFSRPGKM